MKPNNFLQQQQQCQPQLEKKPNLDEALVQISVSRVTYMTNTDQCLKNQDACIHNLEVQMGQIASLLSNRPQAIQRRIQRDKLTR